MPEEKNFDIIRDNLDRLILRKAYAHEVMDEFPYFQVFNLSNIFEYVSDAQFEEMAENFANMTLPGALFAYWNLMVPRKLSQVLPSGFIHSDGLSSSIGKEDDGFFYHSFLIDKRI